MTDRIHQNFCRAVRLALPDLFQNRLHCKTRCITAAPVTSHSICYNKQVGKLSDLIGGHPRIVLVEGSLFSNICNRVSFHSLTLSVFGISPIIFTILAQKYKKDKLLSGIVLFREGSLALLFHVSAAQLSARPVDVPSHLATDCDVDATFFQTLLERCNRGMVGLYKIPLLDRVDRNQVDMTAQRRCQTDQLFRVLFCIVDAADQTIFSLRPVLSA